MASLQKYFPVKDFDIPLTGKEGEKEKGGKKRMSVERIYQRKTQLEHILLRPDTYVGSVEESTEPMFVFDAEKAAIVKRNITYVPGLYKIFDEILVNAADNKQRDPNMKSIKIVIDPDNNVISVRNDGHGIPVEMHATEKMYVPELIFGTLLTSSNYNDEQRKVTGGRNGYGAKLCNIFSTEFSVETACSESGKIFKQTWKNNMGVAGKVHISSSKSDYTKVTFKPDLVKFKMTHLDRDTVGVMTRRAYDIAGCTKGVAVYLNGNRLPVKSFKDYVDLYVKGDQGTEGDDEEEAAPRKLVYEAVNDRWEVAVTASNHGFQQASFVNSIATTKGGTHVSYVVDQVVSKLLEAAKKKNKGGMTLKPFHIKNHLWIFVNCLVENPTFDSQTKENMTLKAKSFGSTCTLSERFTKQALSCGVVDRVLSWARVKSHDKLAQAQKGSKQTKLRGIPKLDDANEAGGRNSLDCTLILTEGDSAKALAVSGLGVVGRDSYGVFPLRGKLLNVREASHNQLMNNEEIKNIVKILGLHYNKKYTESSEIRGLRYGKLLIMTDQDQDGSHIKGLVINFLHHNWPSLIQHDFLQEFITPIVKVTKGNQGHAFYSLPEFDQWKSCTQNAHTWRVKYYKGLGTSTGKEAKEYFSDMERHRIPFKYSGPDDDDAILLAFSKKCVDRRKEWLTTWLQTRRERRDEGLSESLLYAEQTDHISYSDFVNKELILFSNMDNERSIPCSVDGLKPGQRKVLFTCFKRNDKREIKVAQLAGSVAEHSAYHHGEQSLMSTIINLAQNFVGSNNINILQPRGQFGTRLHGGKDAASPRYIFTLPSTVARHVFPGSDESQLAFLKEDNLKIEPKWYCPILPMVLVNGSDGIGTGYSTFVPNYNPREIVGNLRRMMNALEPEEMQPWYKNFTGTIAHVEPQKYMAYGCVGRLSPTSFEIIELPIRTWTQVYKENVLEIMLHGSEKTPAFITDYKEYHTDTTVRFVVYLTAEKMMEAERVGLHKKFKLETSLNTSNLVLFDHYGCLKKYSSVIEILKEFYEVRLDMYCKRKVYLEGHLAAEALKLESQARFLLEKIEGLLNFENKPKVYLIQLLQSRNYPSDPVKSWKKSVSKDEEEERDEGEEEEEEEEEGAPDYNYLSMPIFSVVMEKKEEYLKLRDEKVAELKAIQAKTPKGMWEEDLIAFMEELDRVEEQEEQDLAAGARITVKKRKGKGKASSRQAKLTGPATAGNPIKETRPSPFAEVVKPVIPEFSTERKKPVGKGRGKPKKEAEEVAGEGGGGGGEGKEKQTKLSFEKEKKKEQVKKAKSILESFEISSGSEEGYLMEGVGLRERIALREKKTANYVEVSSEEEREGGGGGEGGEVEVKKPQASKRVRQEESEVSEEGEGGGEGGGEERKGGGGKVEGKGSGGGTVKGGRAQKRGGGGVAKKVRIASKTIWSDSDSEKGGGGTGGGEVEVKKPQASKRVRQEESEVSEEGEGEGGGEEGEERKGGGGKEEGKGRGGGSVKGGRGQRGGGVAKKVRIVSKTIWSDSDSEGGGGTGGGEVEVKKPQASTRAWQEESEASEEGEEGKGGGGGKEEGKGRGGGTVKGGRGKKRGGGVVKKPRIVSKSLLSDSEESDEGGGRGGGRGKAKGGRGRGGVVKKAQSVTMRAWSDGSESEGSGSEPYKLPVKRRANEEPSRPRPQRAQRVRYQIDDSDDSDFLP